MKLALLFDNFGPYHWARIEAAARGHELLAIEVAQRSGEYAWNRRADGKVESGKQKTESEGQGIDGGAEALRVECLFPGTSGQVSAAVVRARVAETLGAFGPAVVFVPGWASRAALAALDWCGQHRVPAVVMSESTAWDEPRSAVKEWVKRQVLRGFSAALAGGTPHADYLVQLGVPRDRIFLGYDAVDNAYFREKAETLKAESRNADSADVPSFQISDFPISALACGRYFLASARFVEKKNLLRLLQAYANYRQKAETGKPKAEMPSSEIGNRKSEISRPPSSVLRPPSSVLRPLSSDLCPPTSCAPWPLVLLGDGPLRADLGRLISDLGLQDCVHLPGFKQYPELPAYYAAAGVFIHASTTEQWGLVVNEAMASGLPVLVSNRCGCARDLVRDGLNGFTFDPYNVEEISDLMLKISAQNFSSPPRPGRGTQGEVSSPGAEPSTFNLQPSTSLAQMGAASQRIVSAWGPDRFAAGLKAAADCALRVGPIQPTLMRRLLVKALLSR